MVEGKRGRKSGKNISVIGHVIIISNCVIIHPSSLSLPLSSISLATVQQKQKNEFADIWLFLLFLAYSCFISICIQTRVEMWQNFSISSSELLRIICIRTWHNLLTYSMAQQPLKNFDRPLMRVSLSN